jgi:hypothetical protein
MASLANKVVKNLEDQGAALGKAVKGAVKNTVKAAPLLLNPELKAGTTALKIGDKVAQMVAESTPASKYGKAGGELKSIRVNGPATTTAKSMSKTVVPEARKIDITTPERTPGQRLGEQKAGDTKRANAIEGASINATKAAAPEVKKLADAGTKVINATKVAAVVSQKVSQPTASNNPVRPAGDSTTKIHPDNKPALGNR